MTGPDDVDGLREGLQQILGDRVHLQTLRQLGLQRAQTFNCEHGQA